MIEEISLATLLGIGILLGFGIGWLLAKGKARNHDKFLEEDIKECITEEELKKTIEDDKAFWGKKKEVENGRKQKYRTTRENGYRKIESKSDAGQPGERGGVEQSENIGSSPKRESVSDIASELIEQHSTEPDANSKTDQSDLFMPERLE